jgi:hypothetical protein
MSGSYALVAVLALSAAGCFTTTVSSGKPPRPATVEWDEHWHHGIVVGLGEVEGNYDLAKICPDGWAELKTETTFANFVAGVFTAGTYSPQTVSIRCAVASGAPAISTHGVPAAPTATAVPPPPSTGMPPPSLPAVPAPTSSSLVKPPASTPIPPPTTPPPQPM